MKFRISLLGLLTVLAVVASLAPALPSRAAAPTPSAELLERQWALARVNAACAWQRTAGSDTVTVAVIDSGVDPEHPDLVGSLRNDGYDFLDDDDDPRDSDGHGTHVAGIIAATLSAAGGVSGLAPGVRILPVRVLDSEGGDDRDIAAGIRFAVEQGARVINLSLGASLLLAASESSPVLDKAITEATAADVLIVVAAGNDYLPLPNVVGYEHPGVMVVAASNEDDRRSRFSNYGAWVSVVAPGEDILSTMPTYDVFLTSEVPSEERLSKDYDIMSGTSMAAPYVAALAALVFSAAPTASAQEVRAVIEASADEGIYASAPSNVQRLRQLGAGRIDACAALQSVDDSPPPQPGTPGPTTATPGAGLPPTVLPGRPTATLPTIVPGRPTATPPPAPTSPLTRTIVVAPPIQPGVPTIDQTAQANQPILPTRTPVPLPRGEAPDRVAALFIEALRAGDLQRANALAAPASLGGEVELDLGSLIDFDDFFRRTGPLSFSLGRSEAERAEVRVSYDLAPPAGQSGRPLSVGGTISMVREGGQWYVQSYSLPGLGS